jgi:hypothetical protein
MKCPSCGYDNRENAPYCDICQTPFNVPQANSLMAVVSPPPRTTPADDPVDRPQELNLIRPDVN